MSQRPPRVPRRAAGIVMRRRRDGAVLLGRRTVNARSWAGTLAFPGGSVDDDDHLLPLLSGAVGEEAAFRGAALREAFEEAGLVSFAAENGDVADEGDVARAVALVVGGRSLRAALADTKLALDDRMLLPLGAWLTAEGSFLVARFLWPVDEAPTSITPPTQELDELELRLPAACMQGWRDGSVFLPPPIRTQLSRLATLPTDCSDDDVAAVMRKAPAEPERLRRDVIDGVVFIDTRTPTLAPATTTNCLVLGCGDVLLVDPATPYADERARFDTLLATILEGRRVAGIVLTHHHHDHIGDVERLRALHGCPVYAHALTAEQLDFDVDVLIDDGHAFVLTAPDDPQRTLRFVAVHTPGHARGHLCLYEPRRRLLVAGDMIAGVGSIIIDPPEGHMATYLKSLDRLIALSPRSVIPAHGGLLTDAVGRLQQQKAHRLARETRVLAAITAGADDVEGIVAAAYGPDTPPAMFAFAARSVLAIVEKLVEDGVVVGDGRWRLRA